MIDMVDKQQSFIIINDHQLISGLLDDLLKDYGFDFVNLVMLKTEISCVRSIKHWAHPTV